MASISNIYATGYQAGGHANSSQLLNGGERSHFIEGQEGSNDCGSMIFQISKGGLSSASVITKAYLTYQVKADSHIIFNGAVNGTNRWELYRVNSCSASGEAFTITSETKIASNNDQRFTTNSTETSSSEYMKENTWVTRSNQAFSLYSDQSINVNYLKVKWTLIERQEWDTSDMTVYVKDLKLHIEYNERYYARFYNNGSLEKTQVVNSGSAATNFTPTKSGGYKFLGWRCSADNKLYSSTSSLPTGTTQDINYTAEWAAIPDINYENLFSVSNWINSYSSSLTGGSNGYTLELDNINGSLKIIDQPGGSTDTYTPHDGNGIYTIPVTKGTEYVFKYNFETNGTARLLLFATNDTLNGFTSVLKDNLTTQSGTSQFTFTPTTNNIHIRIGTQYTDNTYAKFSNIQVYKKSRQTAVNNLSKSRDLNTLTSIYTPTKTGYSFSGWYTSENYGGEALTLNKIQSLTSGTTVYAKWTPISYTIAFNGNGSTSGSVASVSAKYDSPSVLTANSFKKIGYLFKNWNTKSDGTGTTYTNQQSVSNLKNKNGETITLYAQWEFVGDINYDNLFSLSNWYTSIAGQKTGQGGTITANLKTGTLSISCPSNASSADNNICAWDYDVPLQAGESYIFEYDTTIPSGGGTQVHIFYIDNFNSGSWLGFPSTNVYRNESASKVQIPFTLPTNAVGVNFRFGTTNEKGITNTLSNMKLYKQSTYNSSISKINNYKSRDYIPDLASVYSPSKTGYDFNGWTRNEGGTDSLTLQGIKNFTQSTTVYSKWTPYNYYIEFNGNGADNTGTMSTQTFTYDQSKNLTQNGFSRYRHEFVNWNTKADGTGQSYENNSKILNLTAEKNKTVVLYAQWKYAPLGQSIFVKNIPVKKILIDSDEVIEVLNNKAVFFRPSKEE